MDAIYSKSMSSALFTHLLEHVQINDGMSEPSQDHSDWILTDQIPTTGSYTQDKIYRLNQETFWINTLDTFEPGSINNKKKMKLS